LQPARYQRMFVGGVVSHDQVDLLVLRRACPSGVSTDDAQKTQPIPDGGAGRRTSRFRVIDSCLNLIVVNASDEEPRA
jgi:hypothetical protein